MIDQTIKIARPNGWAIRIQRVGDMYYVDEKDNEGYWDEGPEFYHLADAEKCFNERVEELKNIRNWELQRQYDEEHGTDNGYAPWDNRGEY